MSRLHSTYEVCKDTQVVDVQVGDFGIGNEKIGECEGLVAQAFKDVAGRPEGQGIQERSSTKIEIVDPAGSGAGAAA